MHIPDGFIAPAVYLPAYAASAGCWGYGARRMRNVLDQRTLPQLAVLTGLAFVLMMLTIPLPGGSSIHFTGIALLAVLFGVWASFLCVSMVLLLQALLLGAGGITTLPINALAMGLLGSAVAVLVHRALRGWHPRAALFVAAWFAVVLPAALVAVVLGIQPLIAHAADGAPLFFPFDLSVTLPAVVIPHALAGIGEGILTVFVHGAFTRLRDGGSV